MACGLLMSADLGAMATWISRADLCMDVCLHANATTVSLCPPYLLMGSLSHLSANAISFPFQPLNHSDGLSVYYPYQIAL